MESLTLALFVLGLFAAALFLTVSVRRDFKRREAEEADRRREASRALNSAATHADARHHAQPR